MVEMLLRKLLATSDQGHSHDETQEDKGFADTSNLFGPHRPSSMLSSSKFTDRITQATLSEKLKMPVGLTKYNGIDDPD